MAAAFLLQLGAVLLALALHPFVTYPLSLALLARLRPRPVAMGALPPGQRVAVCVCAYNEARVIRAKVENLLAMRQAVPGLEILVYVDAATDGTAGVLRGYGNAIRLHVSPERRGKTHGMNLLIGMTQADLVVFTDANVIFAPDAIRRLLRPFADPKVGCACGHLVYTTAEKDGGNPTAATGSIYWRLEEKIKEMESRTGSVMGADGSIFAIRRTLHRAPPPDIIDDMHVSLAILCDGHRVVRVRDALAFEEIVSRREEEFRRKIRIACQALNVHRMLRRRLRCLSPLDRYKYVSHKLLRWMGCYLMAGAGVAFGAGLALAEAWALLALLLAAALGVGAAARLWPRGTAARLLDIAAAFLATGIGVWRSFRGERFQTWSPPASARDGVEVRR